jgi:hypothetical protein
VSRFSVVDIRVPTAPPLVTLPNVELLRTGQWDVSTGRATFTTDDLAGAVAALECPAVRRPVLKLGHVDPRFDGQPAIGSVTNMATTDDGNLLVGDYAGMPGWMGDVIASAYPDRSVEGQWDYRCQLGHIHPFVVTAVALLGVSAPGVGTLSSLTDVGAMFGVAASTGVVMPQPPLAVSASVSTEDVRRAYYDTAALSMWIEEVQLEPLQLIVMDDATGTRARVPVTVGTGEGTDAVSFGTPVPVIVRYEDAPAPTATAAARYETRAASRGEPREFAITHSSAQPSTTTDREVGRMISPVELREGLGLPADASSIEVAAALAAQGHIPDTTDTETEQQAPAEPAAVPALPDGVVAIDAATLQELRDVAASVHDMRADQRRREHETLVSAAVSDGRIAPARREHWLTALTADEGSAQVLAGLTPGLVPLTETGYAGGPETTTDDDALYAALFGTGKVNS